MTDLNNKLNMNVRQSYTPNFKKGEVEVKPEVKEEELLIADESALKAGESYGRALVKKAGKAENPEMIKGVQESIENFMKYPELHCAGAKAVDHAVDLGASYEQACCGAGDAVEARLNK